MASPENASVNGHANSDSSTNEINGTASAFPSSTSPSLTLVTATEDEKQTVWTKNADEWRGALSLDAYLRREKHLSSQELTAGGGITVWILIDGTDPRRTILSACETYQKRAVIAVNGTVHCSISHGIGSVFCPPECRGRKYGARMMTELAQKLKTWGVRDGETAAFSILYSDIGKRFYHKVGWEPFNSSHISITTSYLQVPPYASLELPQARPLLADDLAELCLVDERLVRSSLQNAPAEESFVALLPDIATIRWHHAREEFVAQEIHGKIPEIKGAIVGNESGKRVWCYFTRMFYNADQSKSEGNTLHVLRIVVEEHGLFTWERASADADMSAHIPAISALFRAALEEAKKWNMAEVEVWNPTEPTVKAAQVLCPNAKVIHRNEESIASLMWYGPRRTSGPIAEEVYWLGNEKYGWC
jgi:GNAT superfamily N-acetyltransferase